MADGDTVMAYQDFLDQKSDDLLAFRDVEHMSIGPQPRLKGRQRLR
jgi:hypothetical protein